LEKNVGPINIVSNRPYSIKDIMEILINISTKSLKTEILNKGIPVWDMVFNNSKMEKYLAFEQKNFVEGLKEEFYNFNITK
jgi:nucleoside-diphosphate-sugar epimerase